MGVQPTAAQVSTRSVGALVSVAEIIEDWRSRVESTEMGTVGVEEEYMLVAPEHQALVSVAEEIHERAAGDARLRLELPPCQVEMATDPLRSMGEVQGALIDARRCVAHWSAGLARPVSAAVHPLLVTFDGLPCTPRAQQLVEQYGPTARRQLVGALQVHVGIGDCDRILAVHDALRSYLPHLAALAASAPFSAGEDQGLASVRPLVAAWLPRHGTPPILGSWANLEAEICWGAASGALDDPSQWWWDLRPSPTHGTLEIRVPDAQPTVADAMGVVELVVALVRWLADRHDAGDLREPAPTWRIDENRWSAFVFGLDGRFVDVEGDGPEVSTRDALESLLTEVSPWAERGLDRSSVLLDDPAHHRLRRVGLDDAIDWLAREFLA